MSSPAVSPSVALAHLLIVDDNNVGLLARKSLLEEQGYRVTAVATPQDALSRLVESAFDAIITDHKLPLMSGVDFIKRIRSEGITVPVILLSGFVDALGLDERNTGANVVLQKCSNEFSHLCRALRTVLRRRLEPKPPGSQRRVTSSAARSRSKRPA
jgi:CheY-like chemotaxis protein